MSAVQDTRLQAGDAPVIAGIQSEGKATLQGGKQVFRCFDAAANYPDEVSPALRGLAKEVDLRKG
jgi:hypothetical protein